MRLRLRPRTVKKRKEAMVEEIEEPAQRRIARQTQALSYVFGDMQRHRPVGSEQAEQSDLESGSLPIVGLERRQRRGRKRQIRILPEPNRLIDGTKRLAPTRASVVQTLQPSERLVEVVPIRRLGKRREKRYSVVLAPHCCSHRLISRFSDRKTVSVNELIET